MFYRYSVLLRFRKFMFSNFTLFTSISSFYKAYFTYHYINFETLIIYELFEEFNLLINHFYS